MTTVQKNVIRHKNSNVLIARKVYYHFIVSEN